MKIILIQDVAGFGNKNEIREAKLGYWRNFLLPRKLAVLATPELIKKAEELKKEEFEKKSHEDAKIEQALKQLGEKGLSISCQSDEKGSLFAGIGAEEISEKIKEKSGLEILPKKIKIKKPIKEIGSHEVEIGEVVLKVEVLKEEKQKPKRKQSVGKKKEKTA
ncbi:MAG: 50S ribosomal protein L9 [Candidatus Pacebacteria bacterium]|nr:50S ribosomal protein L9 [Candidatus Paceibacterota bacterium]